MRFLSLFVLSSALIIGLFTWSACQQEERPMQQRALTDSLERGYQQLQARYQQMGDSLAPPMRQMAGSMQQMHRQMMGADSMGGQGMQRGMGGQGMRGEGMMGQHRQQMHGGTQREWHQQMMEMHRQMAEMHENRQPGMAAQHRRMMQWHQQMFESAPADASPPSSGTETAASGEVIYQRQCATCHGANGQGVAGTFPPLDEAEWVTGDTDRLVRILMHGLQGPVEVGGTRYNGVMPAFGGRLNNEEIAALLTYIRSSWGNQASEVTTGAVQEVRTEYSGRTSPWSASELR